MSLRPGEDVGQAQGIVALNPETGTTTQGETIEKTVANLREAIALDLEGSHGAARPSVVTMFSLPEPA